jgi:hypothetical protein
MGIESHGKELNDIAGNEIELGIVIPVITSRTSAGIKEQRESDLT